MFLFASFPAPISSTSLAFSASSRLVGRAMIGTPYLTLSMTDLHPQWHKNPPTLEWLRIRVRWSHPSTIIALSPTSSRNSSDIHSQVKPAQLNRGPSHQAIE